MTFSASFFGDHAADHQAETPVQVAADAADQGRDNDGGARLVHVADDAVEQAVGQRRGGQHIAHGQDDGHLAVKASRLQNPCPIHG